MEIKAGDFIRTKGGNIGQVLKVIPECKYTTRIGRIAHSPEKYWIDTRKGSMSKPYIKKHSRNIIDLIEEGDYVNGEEVKHIADFEGTQKPIRKVIFTDQHRLIPGETAENDEVKSVVTKEQFNQMKYIVGDESNETVDD